MKNVFLLIALYFFSFSFSQGQRVEDFSLTDAISGNSFALQNQTEAKAVILVFTTLNCPFSKLYEERIFDLNRRFSDDGFVFALVNPHSGQEPEENAAAIKSEAQTRQISIPFLDDGKQILTKQLNITKLPEVVVIASGPTGFSIAYRGAIDNNPQMAANASVRYLENALVSIQNNRNPSPVSTRAVGCNVKRLN